MTALICLFAGMACGIWETVRYGRRLTLWSVAMSALVAAGCFLFPDAGWVLILLGALNAFGALYNTGKLALRHRKRLRVYLEPRDAWIGVYVAEHSTYVCPLPFVVVRWRRHP